jgi:hypothetical protein
VVRLAEERRDVGGDRADQLAVLAAGRVVEPAQVGAEVVEPQRAQPPHQPGLA